MVLKDRGAFPLCSITVYHNSVRPSGHQVQSMEGGVASVRIPRSRGANLDNLHKLCFKRPYLTPAGEIHQLSQHPGLVPEWPHDKQRASSAENRKWRAITGCRFVRAAKGITEPIRAFTVRNPSSGDVCSPRPEKPPEKLACCRSPHHIPRFSSFSPTC